MLAREILDVVQLVYFLPVLIFGIAICLRHGFNRTDGWLYLIVLGLLRIIGSSTGIAYYATDETKTGLVATELICQTIGLAPLLLILLGLTGRVNSNAAPKPPVRPMLVKATLVPIMVALPLAIVGGTKIFSDNVSSRNQAVKFAKIAAMLYLLSAVMTAAIIFRASTKRSTVRSAEQKLLTAGIAVLPFLFVRIIYTVLATFLGNSRSHSVFSAYSSASSAVVVQGVMAVAMEFIIVAIYIVAAMLTPRLTDSHDRQTFQDTETVSHRMKHVNV